METAAGVPQQWRITLKSGQTLGLLADSYEEEGEHYVFNVLVNASEEEQSDDHLVITARTPSNSERVLVAVAMIPVSEVEKILTAKWDPIPVA